MAAAQYRALPPDVAKKRAGIIREADAIKGRMAAAPEEDKHLHHAALAELGGRHERLLAPYRIEAPDAKATIASGGTVAPGKSRPINIDTAAADADEAERATKSAKGGVKGLDMAAIAAADKDKSWHGMDADSQAAAAKTARPEGVAHSTSTPGAAPQTAMAAALAAKGITGSAAEHVQPAQAAATPAPARKKTTASVAPDVADRNNMAVPRGTKDTNIVSGVSSSDSQATRDAARSAATRGARGAGGRAAEAAAAQASTRRSAASAAPSVRGGQQFTRVGGAGEEASSAQGRDWVTPSQIRGGIQAAPASAGPAANSTPMAPAPQQNATPAAPAAPTVAPASRGRLDKTNIIGATPSKGVSPAHMVSSAPGRDWLTPQAANKAKGGKAPKAVVSEEPSLAPAPAANVGGRSAPSSARSIGNVNRAAMPAEHEYSSAQRAIGGVRHNIGPAMVQNTPMAGPQAERAHATSEAAGPPSRTPTPPSGGGGRGRSGAEPRSAEVGGGRSPGVGGGEHSIAIGGDNHGTATVNHNTYNINYGHVGGSQGNVDHGYGPRGGGAPRGGGGAGRGGAGEGHDGKFNVHYNDSTGHHDLRAGLDHIAGRTGGKGEKLNKTGAIKRQTGGTVGGGNQRPIAGSARSAGSGASAPQSSSPTGTTHNWTGPQAGHVGSTSGNGTAQHQAADSIAHNWDRIRSGQVSDN